MVNRFRRSGFAYGNTDRDDIQPGLFPLAVFFQEFGVEDLAPGTDERIATDELVPEPGNDGRI